MDKDRVSWFPMRVTYGREQKVKAFLDAVGVENFLPMKTAVSKVGHRVVKKRVPALSNLIFVRSSMERITLLKQTKLGAEPLRYMVRRALDPLRACDEVIVVPDRQMVNFLRVAMGPEDEYTYLSMAELQGRDQGTVRITSGPFEGVEGVIKRVHGNKQVVVELEGLGGIAIRFVPKHFMVKENVNAITSTTK